MCVRQCECLGASEFLPLHCTALPKNYQQIDKAGLELIEKSIRENYHTGWRSESSYSKEGYRADLMWSLSLLLAQEGISDEDIGVLWRIECWRKTVSETDRMMDTIGNNSIAVLGAGLLPRQH